jgi:hypothetical protein
MVLETEELHPMSEDVLFCHDNVSIHSFVIRSMLTGILISEDLKPGSNIRFDTIRNITS